MKDHVFFGNQQNPPEKTGIKTKFRKGKKKCFRQNLQNEDEYKLLLSQDRNGRI